MLCKLSCHFWPRAKVLATLVDLQRFRFVVVHVREGVGRCSAERGIAKFLEAESQVRLRTSAADAAVLAAGVVRVHRLDVQPLHPVPQGPRGNVVLHAGPVDGLALHYVLEGRLKAVLSILLVPPDRGRVQQEPCLQGRGRRVVGGEGGEGAREHGLVL